MEEKNAEELGYEWIKKNIRDDVPLAQQLVYLSAFVDGFNKRNDEINLLKIELENKNALIENLKKSLEEK